MVNNNPLFFVVIPHLDPTVFKVGERYNWRNQPERLIYLGVEISNGAWHQFAKVESPTVVWCEVRSAYLRMLEPTKPI